LLGRAAFVFPLSAIANYTNTRASSDQASHITFRQQVTKHVLYDNLILKVNWATIYDYLLASYVW